MDNLLNGVVSIATAIVGVALLAVLVSKNANTANVIGASGSAFSSALTAAEGPVLGSSFGSLGNESIGPNFYN